MIMKTMMHVSLGRTLCCAAAFALLLGSCKKDDDDKNKKVVFYGTLSGDAENPPVSTSGTGTVTATYDPATKTVAYTFSWNNLSGPATGMHFHKGAVGVNGPVVIPVTGFPPQASGEVSGTSPALPDSLVTAFMTGNMYANIHTDAHKGGEIRTQMTKQ